MPGPPPQSEPGQMWIQRIDWFSTVSRGFVLQGDILIAGNANGLVALKWQEDGERLWEFRVAGGGMSYPVLADGKVLVFQEDYETRQVAIRALDVKTGQAAWLYPLQGRVLDADPVLGDGVVYAVTEKEVTAVRVSDGRGLWKTRVEQGGLRDAAAGGGLVFASRSQSPTTYAFDGATGEMVWTVTTGRQRSVRVAFAEGHLFVVSTRPAGLSVLDSQTGSELWAVTFQGGTYVNFACRNDTVFVRVSADDPPATGQLYAMRADGGGVIWSSRLDTPGWDRLSGPILAGDQMFIGDDDGYLYSFNAANGSLRWKLRVATTGDVSSPVVISGIVFVMNDQGEILALGARRN